MECRYCRTQNAEDDHRCQRCGRRLRGAPAYTGQSAAAPELSFESVERAEPKSERNLPPAPAQKRAAAYQPALFNSRELPRVVPFESISPSPLRVQEPEREPKPQRPRARKPIPGQQNLQFSGAPDHASTGTLIYCDAPVALPAHRLLAAVLDGMIIAIAMALFAFLTYTIVGGLPLTRATILLNSVVALVLGILYNALCCLGNSDTLGQRWARLRLINFDGRFPTREQRLFRLASGCLSFLSAGLGLLWALVDEEKLTWHDHMSKTFPTPY